MKIIKNNDFQYTEMYRRSENKLPSDWHVESIRNICDLKNGMAFKPNDKNDQAIGLPVVRIQNLNGSKKYDYYDNSVKEQFLIRSGDVLFAWSATLGSYFWNGGDAILNQHIFNVIPKNGADKKWLYYLFNTIITKRAYSDAHGGGGMVHVKKGVIEDYRIPLPSCIEQKNIANFLSERESYLESIQTLISKMEQRNQYYISNMVNGYMDEGGKEVKTHKKTYYIDESWESKSNSEIFKINKNKGISVKNADGLGYPFFKSSEDIGKHSNYLNDGEYLIFGTGGVPVVKYYNGKFSHSTHVMLANSGDYTKYVYYYWLGNMDRLNRCFQGSGLKNLNKKLFLKEQVLIPPEKRMKEIVNFLDNNSRELELFKELYSKEKQVFQWLCEKLVSGEYKIED